MIRNSIIFEQSRIPTISENMSPSIDDVMKATFSMFGMRQAGMADFIAVRLLDGDYQIIKNRYHDVGIYAPREFKLLEMYIELLDKVRDDYEI